MSVGHTPGPWEVREASPNWEVFGEHRSRWVAYAPKAVSEDVRDGTFYPSLSETAANAHLIAAAPDLLEALAKARNTLAGCGMAHIAADICDAAISRATGEQP